MFVDSKSVNKKTKSHILKGHISTIELFKKNETRVVEIYGRKKESLADIWDRFFPGSYAVLSVVLRTTSRVLIV